MGKPTIVSRFFASSPTTVDLKTQNHESPRRTYLIPPSGFSFRRLLTLNTRLNAGIGTDEPAVFVVLPQSKLLGGPPAINKDCMPGDQRGRWRSEEHDGTGDVHRFADTV